VWIPSKIRRLKPVVIGTQHPTSTQNIVALAKQQGKSNDGIVFDGLQTVLSQLVRGNLT
jgi:hypothetical protein